jgi:cyclic 2,3-diphosphoglycerate synthetase
MKKTVVALIDGEHYPPVIKEALDKLKDDPEYDLKGAVFLGGTEKIRDDGAMSDLGVPVIAESEAVAGLRKAIDAYHPDVFIDLSDEPVVGYKQRFEYACLALSHGVAYTGTDFHFSPPIFEDIVQKPSISIIGTGKRCGKTAVSAYVCRELDKRGFDPCIIAMGRGGPEKPEVLHGKTLEMTPEFLLGASRAGRHAASDHYEDALTSRITTVGCRRCGGGMAGSPYVTNVPDGARTANGLSEKFLVFEGSGAAIPPVKTDGYILIAGAWQPEEYITGYFGPYRIFLSELVILTMCEGEDAPEDKIRRLEQGIKKVRPGIDVVRTVFRPRPLEDVRGKRVFLATTAPAAAGKVIGDYLASEEGCEVAGISHNLSNRKLLKEDLTKAGGAYDILLVELKAAAVDVATEAALDEGKRVVYVDNIPVTVGGDGDLAELAVGLADRARQK